MASPSAESGTVVPAGTSRVRSVGRRIQARRRDGSTGAGSPPTEVDSDRAEFATETPSDMTTARALVAVVAPWLDPSSDEASAAATTLQRFYHRVRGCRKGVARRSRKGDPIPGKMAGPGDHRPRPRPDSRPTPAQCALPSTIGPDAPRELAASSRGLHQGTAADPTRAPGSSCPRSLVTDPARMERWAGIRQFKSNVDRSRTPAESGSGPS